jgi:hypothetical protein
MVVSRLLFGATGHQDQLDNDRPPHAEMTRPGEPWHAT